jgi:hypothetical protein
MEGEGAPHANSHACAGGTDLFLSCFWDTRPMPILQDGFRRRESYAPQWCTSSIHNGIVYHRFPMLYSASLIISILRHGLVLQAKLHALKSSNSNVAWQTLMSLPIRC